MYDVMYRMYRGECTEREVAEEDRRIEEDTGKGPFSMKGQTGKDP
jgi:hypothetical protein